MNTLGTHRFYLLTIAWSGCAISACNVPLETFYRSDAAAVDDSTNNALPKDGSTDTRLAALTQRSYITAFNSDLSDMFGSSIALSADGSTLAVGAPCESSAATGIGGDPTNNMAPEAGAVYVFTRSDVTWIQQAYIKASNAGTSDMFGVSVALSADGSTLAVGAPEESSAATGIGGDQTNNSAGLSGAVYVFARDGTMWSQQAYIKASNTDWGDAFGRSIALSSDGSILAVGALGESSFGDQTDNTASTSGAVYMFTRSGTIWSQQEYIKASNIGIGDQFGFSVALSADGTILAVGARFESSAATGIGGDQTDNHASGSGAVYVFTRSGATWTQEAYIKASNTDENDEFGSNVALSSDGATLAVSALTEDSAATGVDGNQADNTAPNSGAVYVFVHSGTTWRQQAYIKSSNSDAGDLFGWSSQLSADGGILLVGAVAEASAATGIGGNQADNSVVKAGAVYMFARIGTTWSQTTYVKPLNTRIGDNFGSSIALSADGSILAIGALGEAGAAGAAYIFQ